MKNKIGKNRSRSGMERGVVFTRNIYQEIEEF